MKKKLLIFLSVLALFFAAGITCVTYAASNEVINYIYVDVKGAVVNPGVYRVSDECRVFQVIEIAGGLTDYSNTTSVNLAKKVSDEMVITIPTSSTTTDFSLININTATAAKLDELPGIGYSLAQAIIDYRTNNGSFQKKEDIKNVSGIKDALYSQIENLITV